MRWVLNLGSDLLYDTTHEIFHLSNLSLKYYGLKPIYFISNINYFNYQFMFDRKGMKKLQKPSRKSRKMLEWEHTQRRDGDRKFPEKKKEGRRPMRRPEDEDKIDWRDLLMEEDDEQFHGG